MNSLMLVLFALGMDHAPAAGNKSYCMTNIAVTARIVFVARWRPGHKVLPPPNGRKAVVFDILLLLLRGPGNFVVSKKRLGSNWSTLSPQVDWSLWRMRLGIWIMLSFFNSHRPSNTVSSITWRTEPPREQKRSVSEMIEFSKGQCFCMLLISKMWEGLESLSFSSKMASISILISSSRSGVE